MEGKLINAITSGKYTVTGIKFIDEKNKTIYFTARGLENTARIDLYAVYFNGTELKKLTVGDYNNSQIYLSPDTKKFVTVYSNVNTPTTMGVINKKEGTLPKSQMLKRLHPDVVDVVWKFKRWHHQVDYRQFKQKKLIRKQDVFLEIANRLGIGAVDYIA